MPTSLPDWTRPNYSKPGGKPFLFFVVYGSFGKLPGLSASQYRCGGIPGGFSVSQYDAQKNADVLASFQEGYVWDQFRTDSPALADQVAVANECLILRGEVEDRETLDYLRDAVGFLTFLLDHGGIAIYDPFMIHWWNPDEWRKRVFAPAAAVPRSHVVILLSPESQAGETWYHTRGMRKFGRPDLSIHNVPAEYDKAIIDLCERFIELQAFGGIIEEGQQIKMKSLPDGMRCHRKGDLDDPDFNNVHVEISWPK